MSTRKSERKRKQPSILEDYIVQDKDAIEEPAPKRQKTNNLRDNNYKPSAKMKVKEKSAPAPMNKNIGQNFQFFSSSSSFEIPKNFKSFAQSVEDKSPGYQSEFTGLEFSLFNSNFDSARFGGNESESEEEIENINPLLALTKTPLTVGSPIFSWNEEEVSKNESSEQKEDNLESGSKNEEDSSDISHFFI